MGNKKPKKRKPSANKRRSMMESVAGDYHFLSDDNTVSFIRRSRVMFIMRGLPGSGKSTVVSLLKSRYQKAVVCSADAFFWNADTNAYEFDVKKLPAAHADCQQSAQHACEARAEVVIIDNTNVRNWEMRHYTKLASEHDYTVVCVVPNTEWAFDPVVLATKNKHNVSEELLKKRCRTWDECLPYYWAWFLNNGDSANLLSLAAKYLKCCYDSPTMFRADLARIFQMDDVNWGSVRNQYQRPPRSRKQIHCTAFYGGSGNEARDRKRQYASRQVVRQSMGKTFALHVIGFIVTPRTIGARVLLNHRQLLLWANDAEHQGYHGHAGAAQHAAGPSSLPLDEGMPSDVTPSTSVASLLQERPRFHPSSGRGSRAHLTLMVAPGQEAAATGGDMDEIVQAEAAELHRGRPVPVDGGALRYYGEGRCAVYLDQPIRVCSLFSGKY